MHSPYLEVAEPSLLGPGSFHALISYRFPITAKLSAAQSTKAPNIDRFVSLDRFVSRCHIQSKGKEVSRKTHAVVDGSGRCGVCVGLRTSGLGADSTYTNTLAHDLH